jgi:hypothetical protein
MLISAGLMDLVRLCCRAGLTPADAAFIRGALGGGVSSEDSERTSIDGGDAFDRLLADEDTRDLLLDQPPLRRALLETPAAVRVSPYLYFYVLVRHALRESGVDDRAVADYVASVLVAHAPASAQPATGRRGALFYVSDLLEQMRGAGACERFHLGVRLADLALLAAGVFSDQIRYRERHRAAPGLGFYEAVGRTHYRLAGGHQLAQEFQLERVYQTLAEAFPVARRALNFFGENLVFLGGASLDGAAGGRN